VVRCKRLAGDPPADGRTKMRGPPVKFAKIPVVVRDMSTEASPYLVQKKGDIGGRTESLYGSPSNNPSPQRKRAVREEGVSDEVWNQL
jgi:hypothetical protein